MSDKKQKQNQEPQLKTDSAKEDISPQVDENVKRLLQSVADIPKSVIDRAFKRELQTRELTDYCEAINSILTEFLSSYALIGYDLEGNPVHIVNTPSAKDYNGVVVEMSKVLAGMNSSIRGNN